MNESRPRILVVEDQESVRTMLGRVLAKSGFDADVVASGEAALLRLKRTHEFSALVTDLLMPGLHGVAFLKLVRELEPHLPVIVLTGSDLTASALAAAGCAVTAYLRKPQDTLRLAEVVEAALGEADRRTAG